VRLLFKYNNNGQKKLKGDKDFLGKKDTIFVLSEGQKRGLPNIYIQY